MARRIESLKDMVPESRQHDVLREGIICFLIEKTIIPVRATDTPPSSFGKEGTYYCIVYF